MRTPTQRWLLSLFAASLPAVSAFAQTPSVNAMRIDPSVQRERDATRLDILREERDREARELAAAQSEARRTPNAADIEQRIALHQQNLSSLDREIALARQPAGAIASGVAKQQRNDWLIRNEASSPIKTNDASPLSSLPPWLIPAVSTEAIP